MIDLKTVKDLQVNNKRVLIRVDFNVVLDNHGEIIDDWRIKKAIPTIEYLINQGAKIVLMSHLGRPKGKRVRKLKMNAVQDKLFEYLDCSVVKADNCIGKKIERWTKQMKKGEILLLENLRFHSEEEENNFKFAKQLAKLGDIYINEAFAVSHRKHASIVGVSRLLPSAIGMLFEKELQEMNKILYDSKHPLAVIIGGAKAATKIKVIQAFSKKADHLLLGGALVNTIFAAQGMNMGKSLVEKKMFQVVNKIDFQNEKVHLPIDFMVWTGASSDGVEIQEPDTIQSNELVYDIGPRTVKMFLELITKAKMVVWNGPLGKTEQKPFDKGSQAIASAIANNSHYSIAGGGDTVAFIKQLKLQKHFNYISTGGGAMLEYLSNKTLPGIEALKNE